ncbi:MAG: NFACT RNA binding domain-containing protein [archaeon]
MKFREFLTTSGTQVFLGRNAENNDELVQKFKGEENIIMHTAEPGSPFCVINNLTPSKRDVEQAAVFCASKSQDWRDNKADVIVHRFSGKDVEKKRSMETGTWRIKKTPTKIKIKRKDIEEFLKNAEKS